MIQQITQADESSAHSFRAECLRRYAYKATVTADAEEYALDAREADTYTAIVASIALAAPTGGGE